MSTFRTRRARGAAVAAMAALLAPALSRAADYAHVVTSTICDNQADSMDVAWRQQSRPGGGAPKLFYFDGSTFTALGHAQKLSDFSELVISAHGAPGQIAGVSGQVFAGKVKAAHAIAPDQAYFMVCSAAAPPSQGKLSVVGELAAQYPAQGGAGTAIATASGPLKSCALRKPTGGSAAKLGDAIYYDGVQISASGQEVIKKLLEDWSKETYPEAKETYEAYCHKALATPALLPAFITTVATHFGADYLALINLNTGGAPLQQCGSATAAKTCP